MRARRMLFARERSRTRLVPVCVALLSLASLGLAGFFAGVRQEPALHSPDQPAHGDAAADSRPVEGVLRAPSQGRDASARKTWM